MGAESCGSPRSTEARIDMAIVTLTPMPRGYLKISHKFRPRHPPIFPDGDPSPDDIELARALFVELDPESQEWYRRSGSSLFAGL